MKWSYCSSAFFCLSKIVKDIILHITLSSIEPFAIAQMRRGIRVGNGKRKMNLLEDQKEFDSAEVGRKFQIRLADP